MRMSGVAATAAMVFLSSLFVLVAGCGGGGGEDDEEEEFDNDATGIWRGTHTPDGKTGVVASVVVDADGRFAVTSELIFLSGTGSVSGDRLSASAKGWPPTGSTFANGSTSATFSLTGTVLEGNRIDSSYSGANESGRFALTYDATRSNRPASLTLAAGSYVTSGGGALAINSNGSVTLNSPNGPNCVGNGTISVRNPSRNVYTWLMTLSGCTSASGDSRGVAYMLSDTQIIMLGSANDGVVLIAANK